MFSEMLVESESLMLMKPSELIIAYRADRGMRSATSIFVSLPLILLSAAWLFRDDATTTQVLQLSAVSGFGLTVQMLITDQRALQALYWKVSHEDQAIYQRYCGVFTIEIYSTALAVLCFFVSGATVAVSWTKFGQGALVGCLLLYPIFSWIRAIRSARTGKG
jgi:hypothetical protein